MAAPDMAASPSTNLLDDLMAYMRFTAEDAARLRSMGPVLRPHFAGIVDRFYEAIDRTPGAIAVFTGGPAQIERQKRLLHHWLEGLVAGPYDDAYYERRARIGRTHVRIGLDQQYMFGAMNLIREGLHAALRASEWADEPRSVGHTSIDRLCDIELAIMIETYREAYTARVKDAERLATIGQVAASIGHELRNPLAVMQTSVHQLQRRAAPDDERTVKHLRRLCDQITLCNSIISNLLELARDRAIERRTIDVAAVVREAVASVPRADGVALLLELSPELPEVAVDPGQFRQIVVNLVQNAVQAVGAAGMVTVGLARADHEVRLRVDDSGPGLAPEVLRRLFEPLFTTRANGTGLGLALCRRIVEKHGGGISASNLAGGGASFLVSLPLTQETQS